MIGCFVEMVLGKDRSWLTGGWSHFRSSPPELESFGRVGVIPQGRLCLFCCFQLSASEGEVCDELRLSSSAILSPSDKAVLQIQTTLQLLAVESTAEVFPAAGR